jgi:amino acid permease
MIIARCLFAMLSAFSYPLQTFPCRSSLEHLLPLSLTSKQAHSRTIHTLLTMAILLGTYSVAFCVKDLVIISEFIGTLAGIPICYLFPFLFYFKLSEGRGWTAKRIAAACMAGFGLFAMAINSLSLVYTMQSYFGAA